MKNNLTFSMIKPEAVQENNTGNILSMIETSEFKIKGCKMTKMTLEEAKKFYLIHKERPFYDELCTYICQGPVVVLILEKNNAVLDFRKLIGATNPKEAEEGTIRKKYGKSLDENAIHGSDSDENAKIEIQFFFSKRELLDI